MLSSTLTLGLPEGLAGSSVVTAVYAFTSPSCAEVSFTVNSAAAAEFLLHADCFSLGPYRVTGLRVLGVNLKPGEYTVSLQGSVSYGEPGAAA